MLSLTVTSRDFPLTDGLRSLIDRKAGKLGKVFSGIRRMEVVIESPHRSKSKGKPYEVRLDIAVPGSEVVVRRKPHQDAYLAISDAFEAARRILEERFSIKRGQVKSREETPAGRIAAIYPGEGFGFAVTPEGQEVYFHESSVLGGNFSKLDVGTKVRFNLREGREGPRATAVDLA